MKETQIYHLEIELPREDYLLKVNIRNRLKVFIRELKEKMFKLYKKDIKVKCYSEQEFSDKTNYEYK